VPSWKVHRLVDKIILGREYPEVHRALDLPYIWLGPRHRILFHDPASAMLLGYAVAGPGGALSALLHITLDRELSKMVGRRWQAPKGHSHDMLLYSRK
jgi:hypothetical protein